MLGPDHPQQAPGEMDLATLPTRALEVPGDGRPQSGVVVGGHQLDARSPRSCGARNRSW